MYFLDEWPFSKVLLFGRFPEMRPPGQTKGSTAPDMPPNWLAAAPHALWRLFAARVDREELSCAN
jgi:hypothetical protein